MILPKGNIAPDFDLFTTPDQKLSLADFKGKRVILSFYPANWSPVCGDQMSLYNETSELFHKFNAELIGISVDSKWRLVALSQNRNSQFPLLSDFEPKEALSKLYGAYDETNGESKRAL